MAIVAILLMVIVVILLMAIVAILLMASGYSTNGYWWLFY
jgi:hypothetical protein